MLRSVHAPAEAHVLVIRSAAPGDAGLLAVVHVEGRRWAYRGSMPDELLDGEAAVAEREARWARVLAAPRGRAAHLLAERGGEAVGFVSSGPSREDDAGEAEGEVYALYLRREELAGQGLGRALMAEAVARLRAFGFRSATLQVLTTNDRARRFYEAAGWRVDGVETFPEEAGIVLPHTRYRREL